MNDVAKPFRFGNVEDWHTDAGLATNGAPFDCKKGRTIWVRRAGGGNRKLIAAMATVNPDDAGALHDIYARLVVTDWEGFVDPEGEPIPFSAEACIALFNHCPDLFFDLLIFANNRSNYRAKAHAEDEQAVKPQSGGSEAQALTSGN